MKSDDYFISHLKVKKIIVEYYKTGAIRLIGNLLAV